MDGKIVEFLRKKDFVLERELGEGACGKTVLLHDTIIGESFACKKYAPARTEFTDRLFNGFVREIKLLHLINHQNVVRVFNYYLFPEKKTGFILMEYVKGADIGTHLAFEPQNINEVFQQTIDGFAHLEENGILHRDIREENILVNEKGIVKIIDFGFGRQTIPGDAYNKSISLNWWCDLPAEFKDSKYDFATEVYFVGKLFEKIIIDQDLQHFKHSALLGRMCAYDTAQRIASFSDIRKAFLASDFDSIDFDPFELRTYRVFSSNLANSVSKIERSAKYHTNAVDIQTRLEDVFKKVMLEESMTNGKALISCFVNGSYSFFTNIDFPVNYLKDFINLFRSASREKKNIIVANLLTRLDAVSRYDAKTDDDIPF